MTSSDLVHTEAVMLRRVPYRESDLIVTFLTRDSGKVSALARAARRSQRRFAGALSYFTVSEIELSQKAGRELGTLRSASPRQTFLHLAADMTSFSHASYATELVRDLTVVGQGDVALFDLMVMLFRTLSARGGSPSLLRGFELAALSAVGLGPVLGTCVACGGDESALSQAGLFDIARGGTLCPPCGAHARGQGVRPLSVAARIHLHSLAGAASLDSCVGLEAPPDVAREVRGAMLSLIEHHLGHRLKTVDFVRQLAAAQAAVPSRLPPA